MHGISQVKRNSVIVSFLSQGQTVYFVALFFSFLLSYIASFRADVVNPDGICYLQSAAAMKEGFQTAMHVCGQAKWPFFSLLIYGLVQATHLTYVSAALLLDAAFSAISVLTFIGIVSFLKDSRSLRWWAALVILLSHEFNSIREYIIRDHGFWAFYLLSIFCLLNYVKHPSWRRALAWSSSIVIATLFRIEGIFFLILMPFVVFFIEKPVGAKVQAFFKLNTFTLLSAFLIVIWMLTHISEGSSNFGRLGEVQFQVGHGLQTIVQRFDDNVQTISQQVLSPYAHDAKLVLGLVLIVWYLLSVTTNVSLIYTFLIVLSWWQKALVAPLKNHAVLWGYVILNVFITLIFLIENMFLSKRYLIALSLTLMLWVPFALEKLFSSERVNKKGLGFIILFILLSSLGGIFQFGYSKQYIRLAGEWLNQNVPPGAAIYSNDEQVMYYSQRFGNEIFKKSQAFSEVNIIADQAWKHYDYVAIRTHFKERTTSNMDLKELGHPVQVFANKRGDGVEIYQVH